MSQATTPHAFAIASAMPVSLLTSVNVPFPLLWNNQHGIGSYTRGIQYQRSLVSRLPHHLFFPLLNSTNRQTNKSSRPSLSSSNLTALQPPAVDATPAFSVTCLNL